MSEIDEAFTVPVQPVRPDVPVTGGAVLLDEVTGWFRRFVYTVSDADHDLLALWAAHSHLAVECYTTPRLQLDSPMPGSGKTTVLEHLSRLCRDAISMASLSSPALLARMLDKGIRTVLIDEADRSLNPDKDGVADLFAVLNSGYKRGATRPVLVPVKGGGWDVAEMPTFAPVALAGNNPNLPDDTRSRIIRVLLLPDLDGNADESDWELIEDAATELHDRLAAWCNSIRDAVRTCRPALPERVTGRFREKWGPLARIAELAGGRWPAAVADMARADREQYDMDKEDGLIRERPAVLLLRHLYEVWPGEQTFVPTSKLLAALVAEHPEVWGKEGPYGKALTAQRLGRMLVASYKLNSSRERSDGPRGYMRAALTLVWRRMRVADTPPDQTGQSGPTGPTGPADAGSAGSAGPAGYIPDPLPLPEPTGTRCWCGQYVDPDDPDGFCGAGDPEHDEARAAVAS